MMRWSNKAAPGPGAITLLFQFSCLERSVPEQRRCMHRQVATDWAGRAA